MISIRKATEKDLEAVMSSRMEMLKVVNHLPETAVFEEDFINITREYFLTAEQTTVLAMDKESQKTVGCATICYIRLMPTVDHPGGKRAHIMNVYTKSQYRGQGIGLQMMNLLISEAREKGVTEISLDATESGKRLYARCGFVENKEGMVFIE